MRELRLEVCKIHTSTHLVVAYESSVQGVLPIVLVLRHLELVPVNLERAILDSVGVSAAHEPLDSSSRLDPPDNGADVGVARPGLLDVEARVIVPDHNIPGYAVLVIDEEARQPRSVRQERRVDTVRGDRDRHEGVEVADAVGKTQDRQHRGGEEVR